MVLSLSPVGERINGVLSLFFYCFIYFFFVTLDSMSRFVAILAFLLCSALSGQGRGVTTPTDRGEVSAELISSIYVEQIECEREGNNFAEQSVSISAPVSSVSLSLHRTPQPRVATTPSLLHSISSGCYYCIRFSLYLLTGRRSIDYYLYTLCQLRL